MMYLYTLAMLTGLSVMQAPAQELPETFVVVIGQVGGFKDGETFNIMESNGQETSIFFHKSIPDDNGTVKDGRFTAIYPYKRMDLSVENKSELKYDFSETDYKE